MYVFENTTGNSFLTPGTGRIVRVDSSGKKTVIVTRLSVPTALTCGPDGKKYVSNVGLGPQPNGGGQILQVTLLD